jgi:hypothetical protein
MNRNNIDNKYVFTVDELCALIEGIRLRRYDGFFSTVSQAVYSFFQDDSFDWIIEQLKISRSNDEMYNYSYILLNIGRFSDGFPEEFLKRVIAILEDPLLHVGCKIFLYNGIFNFYPFYRNDNVYDIMEEICHWMIKNGDQFDLIKHCSLSLNDVANFFKKRQQIIKHFEIGNIIIPQSLISSAISGNSLASKRFIGMGFNQDNYNILIRAMKNIWAIKGPDDVKPSSKTLLLSVSSLPSISKKFTIPFYTHWINDDRGIYYAQKIALAPEEPLQEEDWCICPIN